MAWKWTLPDDTVKHLNQAWQAADHLGLLLDKFTPYVYDKSQKRDWLKEVLKHTQSAKTLDAIKANRARWTTLVVERNGIREKLYTASPLIVGLGAGHVLETAITLDRNTGAPLIPGSALKGLARTVGLVSVAESLNLPEIDWLAEDRENDDSPPAKLVRLEEWIVNFNDLSAPEALEYLATQVLELDLADITIDRKALRLAANFRAVFGTTEHVGGIVFLDGLYAGDRLPNFHIDIMTPHFPDYYMGNSAPSDDQNPRPVPYLTVATGQPFVFAILPRTPDAAPLIKRAGSWLLRGLKEFGIGAKTAQGYGLFRSP